MKSSMTAKIYGTPYGIDRALMAATRANLELLKLQPAALWAKWGI